MQVFKLFLKLLGRSFPICLLWIGITVSICIVRMIESPNGTQEAFQSTKVRICIFDEDNSPESQALCDYLSEKHERIIIEDNEDMILDMMFYQQLDYALRILPDYGEKLHQGQTEDLLENYAYSEETYRQSTNYILAQNDIAQYIQFLSAAIRSGTDTEIAIKQTEAALEKTVAVTINQAGQSNNNEFSVYFYFDSISYAILTILTMLIPRLLSHFTQKDLANRLNSACLSLRSKQMQLTLGCLVFVILLWLLFLIIGCILIGGIYTENAWLCVLNSLVFLLVALSLALVISSCVTSLFAVNAISNIIGLGMCFLSGVFVPMEILGDSVKTVAHFLPMYWYVESNALVSRSDFSWAAYGKTLLIEGLFAVLFFLLFLAIHKAKQQHLPQKILRTRTS